MESSATAKLLPLPLASLPNAALASRHVDGLLAESLADAHRSFEQAYAFDPLAVSPLLSFWQDIKSSSAPFLPGLA
jgi:hypothetical protein